MPTPTRVALILLALLAVLLLAYAALLWLTQDAAVDELTERGADRDDAATSIVLFLLAYGVIGLTAAASAVGLSRRRSWARLTGILVTSLLAGTTLLSVLFSGGVTPLALLVLISAVAALTSLLSGATKQWLREIPTA
jgi:hypothetical protein